METNSHKKTLKIKSKTGSAIGKTSGLTKTQRKRKAKRIKLILEKKTRITGNIKITRIF